MNALEVAQYHLGAAQKKIKGYYDQKAKYRSFAPGEEVLVLLPLQGQPLSARYCGPYVIEKKVGNLDYLVATLDRRKRAQLCYVNMLKLYFRRKNQEGCFSSAEKEASLVLFFCRAEEVTEILGSEPIVPAEHWEQNCVLLLEERLQHLEEVQKREFDRQSEVVITGVKPMDKREGAGYFNLGSDRDQIEEQLNATPTEQLDTSSEIPEKALEEGATSAEEEVHHGCKKVLLPIDFQSANLSGRGSGHGRGRGRGRGKGVLVERASGRFFSRTVLERWPVLWLVGQTRLWPTDCRKPGNYSYCLKILQVCGTYKIFPLKGGVLRAP